LKPNPTLALTPDEELAMLYKALPKALEAASISRRRKDEDKLAAIVARIRDIERGESHRLRQR
jgi:hypothetical protein